MTVDTEHKESSLLRKLRLKKRYQREFLSEALGTFVLTFFSMTATAQYILSRGQASNVATLALTHGFGVTMAVYMGGEVSGGFVNPAISFAMALTGRLPWKRLPVHVVAQHIGAFVAACVTFGLYKEALDHFDGGHRSVTGVNQTATIFCSFPQDFLTIQNGFFDSMMSTGMLTLCVHAFLDRRNMAPDIGLIPVSVGFCIFVLVSTLGYNCGAPINPARDLSPRLFAWLAGWGSEMFSVRHYLWFWVPIVAPCVGSALFTLVYWAFVAHHWPREGDDDTSQQRVKFNKDVAGNTATDVQNGDVTAH